MDPTCLRRFLQIPGAILTGTSFLESTAMSLTSLPSALMAAKEERARTQMSIAGTKDTREMGIEERSKGRGSTSDAIRSQAGFSLLELVAVLMLLALATAIVIPSLGRGLATVQLKTSSREIAAAIRLARSKAVREQQV